MFSTVFCFFEFSAPEILLILFVTLLLFGGDKLPGLARGLGKGIRDFKDASEGVKREINSQIDNFESKKKDEPAKATEETPLIAENSTDNPDGVIKDDQVVNTMPVGDSTHVAGTDQVVLEHPEHNTEQVHEHEAHVSAANKEHE